MRRRNRVEKESLNFVDWKRRSSEKRGKNYCANVDIKQYYYSMFYRIADRNLLVVGRHRLSLAFSLANVT